MESAPSAKLGEVTVADRAERLLEQRVALRHGEVHLWRKGSGTPVVILHGGGGPEMWLDYLARWPETNEVILTEHPGFGKAGLPAWLETIDDLAYSYLDLFGELGLANVHLVGHSLGGWLAMEVAVRNCAPLRSLTLVSSPGVRVEGMRIADNFLWTPEEAARALFADPELRARQLAQGSDSDGRLLRLQRMKTVAKLVWSPRWYNPALAKWLHRITCPTQIVWGRQDGFIPPDYATALAAMIPGATLAWLDDCGHLPHLEQPGAFAEIVARFFTKVAP